MIEKQGRNGFSAVGFLFSDSLLVHHFVTQDTCFSEEPVQTFEGINTL